MFKNIKKEESFILLCSFWATVVLVRAFLFIDSILRDRNPRIMIENFHIHHYLLGLSFIFFAGASAYVFEKRKTILQLAAFGIGTGLFIDEFSFFFNFLTDSTSDYWSIINFLAIVAFGVFLLNALRLSSGESTMGRNVLFGFRFNLIPIMVLAVFLFGLFYDANPAISQAKEIRPIIKNVKLIGDKIKIWDSRR